MSLNEQAQEILRIAEQHGVDQNFFFLTTFKTYQVQIGILNDIEKQYVRKEYWLQKNILREEQMYIPTPLFPIITEQPTARTKQL